MVGIRIARAEDVKELSNIQKSAFLPIFLRYHDTGNPCLYGTEDITKRLESRDIRYYCILENGKLVGGMFYKCSGSTPFGELGHGEYHLGRIYIDPDRQNRGIARRAIMLGEREFPDAVRFTLEAPEELRSSRFCYSNAGFDDTGERLEISPGLVLAAFEKRMKRPALA